MAVGVSGEESVNCGTVMTLWDKIWSDKRQKTKSANSLLSRSLFDP